MPMDWHQTNLYGEIRQLVCSVIYGHTDVLEILIAIDTASAANPNIPVREAAYLAVIEIAGIWVARLMKVGPVTA